MWEFLIKICLLIPSSVKIKQSIHWTYLGAAFLGRTHNMIMTTVTIIIIITTQENRSVFLRSYLRLRLRNAHILPIAFEFWRHEFYCQDPTAFLLLISGPFGWIGSPTERVIIVTVFELQSSQLYRPKHAENHHTAPYFNNEFHKMQTSKWMD
jgi:hypothetical protein